MAAAVLPIKSYAIKSEVKKEINISFTGLILIIKEKKIQISFTRLSLSSHWLELLHMNSLKPITGEDGITMISLD